MGKRRRTVTSLARFVRMMGESTSQEKEENEENPREPVDIQLAGTRTEEDAPRKRSKRIIPLGDKGRYNARDLVPSYSSVEEVPDHLQKYYAQRFRYFSRFDEGCLLDEEGWYSVTPEKIADQIAERCRCETILDPFCGVGGNAIAFAKTCNRVVALDISPIRLALARHNAIIYGVADRIEFILADFVEFATAYQKRPPDARCFDVVFLSPPWGGPSYIDAHQSADGNPETPLPPKEYSLKSIEPIPGDELFRLTRKITNNIAYFLPRNIKLDEISQLVDSAETPSELIDAQRPSPQLVEIEEEYMSGKLKALTCYFGGLAEGQDELF